MNEITKVKNYWDSHPLFSYEVKYKLGSFEYFKEIDRIKREDVERFCMDYWDFPDFSFGKSLLDIGCGPGFLTRHFASKGYSVTAIDLSNSAVELTKKSLELYSLHARVLQDNAESLKFEDNSFDYVISSGVLHHTPDTRKSVLEACRVLKPGGRAKITLYYKNVLLRYPFWQITKFFSKIMLKSVPGRDRLVIVNDPNEFIRMYDGDNNPVGKGYSLSDVKQLLCPPFKWANSKVHFFPARFMPQWFPMNKTIHRFLDAHMGTMIYTDLLKI